LRPPPLHPAQLSDEDKKKVLDAVKEAQEWVEENSDAEADEYKDRLKDAEDVVSPIFAKVGARRGACGPRKR
jgi:TRAP-type C4-dicarboxylate transport system substrate-binding protein